MAKKVWKVPPKRAAKKKDAGKGTARSASAKGKASATRSKKAANVREKHRGPRDQSLPGMEQHPLEKLNSICTDIAETREAIAELQNTEAGNEQSALQLMRRHDRTSYQHAGVTLLRVPGEEKLQVKRTRTRTATAEVEPDESPEGAGHFSGDGAEPPSNIDIGGEGADVH